MGCCPVGEKKPWKLCFQCSIWHSSQSTFNNFNWTFSLAIWGLMVGADQFVFNTILPNKFSKLQTGKAWAIVTDKGDLEGHAWQKKNTLIFQLWLSLWPLYPFWVSIGDYEQNFCHCNQLSPRGSSARVPWAIPRDVVVPLKERF